MEERGYEATGTTERTMRVDLHAGLTHLLQSGNDPDKAMPITVFSKI